MTTTIRPATRNDLAAIHRFADEVVHDTYDAMVGAEYASSLVETWWTPDAMGPDVRSGRVLLATDGVIVGLAHVGEWRGEPVMWKLYVADGRRGHGIGLALVDELIARLPHDTVRLRTEHIVANRRAGSFYEREGFTIDEVEGDPADPTATVWRSKQLEPDWSTYVASMERAASVSGRAMRSIAGGLAIEAASSILDVGCGVGAMAVIFAEVFSGADVVAADNDPAMRVATRRRVADRGLADRITVRSADVQRPTARLAPADLVWASLVVHHQPDQLATLRALHDVVNPGGRLALAEGGLPSRSLPWDLGIGRPGLEIRLDAAQDEWFRTMRDGLPGSVAVDAGWPVLLRRAGFTAVASRTVLVDKPAPLDDDARQVVVDHLAWAIGQFADRLDADDVDTVRTLLDDTGDHYVGARDDVHLLSAQTVHVARR